RRSLPRQFCLHAPFIAPDRLRTFYQGAGNSRPQRSRHSKYRKALLNRKIMFVEHGGEVKKRLSSIVSERTEHLSDYERILVSWRFVQQTIAELTARIDA